MVFADAIAWGFAISFWACAGLAATRIRTKQIARRWAEDRICATHEGKHERTPLAADVSSLVNALTSQVIWCGGNTYRFRDFHDRSLSRGQKLSRRAREERVCKFLLVLRRVCWLLSRGSSQGEPDFHLLFQTSEWS